jgi:hypothetical protein
LRRARLDCRLPRSKPGRSRSCRARKAS